MILNPIVQKLLAMFERESVFLDSLRRKAMSLFNKHPIPRWMIFMLDCVSVFLIFIFAYLLRYNLIAADFRLFDAIRQGIVVTGVFACFSLIFRSFSGLIRHTTVRDIFSIFLTNGVSLVTLVAISLISRQLGGGIYFTLPISILLIHFLGVASFQFVVRIAIKMFFELITFPFRQKKNVVIFGAGSMGVIVMKVITADQQSDYQIQGFFDNNRVLQGRNLNGFKVYNPRFLTRGFLEDKGVDMMIFAINNIPPQEKSEIIRMAVDLDLEVLDTPDVETWLNGRLQLGQLKKVKLEDLLGRDPIKLNQDAIGRGLKDRTILVTGAAGSIGSEIVRQLSKFEVGKMVLVDNAETPMFHLENELKNHFVFASCKIILADITDPIRMEGIFREFNPEVVFHAAAYKHVPMLEGQPHEAVRVNVRGTTIVTNLSLKYKVDRFVMVSTDKAVNPANVMGATKRICEMVIQARSMEPDCQTQFIITRFGNVLGSNGSVIPIFERQIREGGPVTVTHPDITRFFMTIPEACLLVLEAGFMGKGGEIFVFDMGEPVRIDDLARRMIKLSGYKPDEEIKIEYTGLRPGEKLFEELLGDKERTLPTFNPKVKIAEVSKLDHRAVLEMIHTLNYTSPSLSVERLIEKLKEIVPEYEPDSVQYIVKDGDASSVELEAFPD